MTATENAPAATPRQRRRERTRRTILDAARRLLIECGPRDLSLRAVARECDYSPAALYEYFQSKEALLQEVLGDGFEELQERLLSIEAARPPADRLLHLGLAYIDFARHRPELFQLLFTITTSSLTSLEAVRNTENHFALLRTAMFDHLRERGVDPEVGQLGDAAVYGFWALVHGQAMLQNTFLKEFDADFATADHWTIGCYLSGLSATA